MLNCQTIAEADLDTIIGKDVAETNPFGDLACTWIFAGSPSVASGDPNVSLYVWILGTDQALASVKDRLPGGQDVSIGDRGYWVESDSSLYVVKGAHSYGISLSGFDPADPRQDMAIEIARLLLAKV